ncbi:IclR family transcriptional regulator [Piscinibacter sp.]|uniref:IclR family transcriptional regulator n=1 Tax=Piscinibacter sp. TaxID=1903157 RepID=UPI002B7462BE|nr:IclR family transcriptional regulator [Albitalea sp.]HUG23103.1 IclR family transcriptional regulator [Albitalea sp.]
MSTSAERAPTAKVRKTRLAGETAHTSHVVTEIDDDDPDFVSAIGRGFAILRCFKRNTKVLGNKELAQLTGLPKSTIARLTYTLTKLGYLEFLPAQEKYSLGIGALTLGQTYLAGLDAREVAHPLMQQLADDVGATVALGAHHGQDMVFLDIAHGNQVFMMRVAVGQRVPHGMTALGRAYIAALSPEEREKFGLDYRSRVKPQEWPRVEEVTQQAIRDYEKYGFCFSMGEWSDDVFAAGVPMVSNDGSKILAFSCSGPVHEMTRKRLIGEIGPRLMQLRDRVHATLGGVF